MKGNLKRPDFRELMNPLLRTTAGILFFSWFFLSFSAFAIILFIFPGNSLFRKCVREQRRKKRWELTVQFKECLLAVANSSEPDTPWKMLSWRAEKIFVCFLCERSAMYGELELIRRGRL